ncbi:hypothetical protein SELMODRAFT_429709 [Selaginella moellendorffii]|uniref:NADP-dependent oxidoreductase domain-containing protein n=1 Tax=Selaginella moellendorffii TaxID=88036 RepID=D8T719_SELML|nr:aldo-keto reductase family 4 member C10 [Selaginella moellendorffii]XP_024520925.1 aldo-keto reductase family 4 member C10 [Selaginella moellendorffii]EFJ07544.1 hypothetical protein SELMODRAFT_429709 [Selaginella moellendorffii]|eukprot:XP_002991432.1 aldo-keto reductase family 4 member C10 [Selaginella moellendorffii]
MGSEGALQFKLSNGALMPGLGLGTWQAEKGVVGEALKAALQAGYRHLDCASAYGNQKEIGDALQEAFKSGDLKREDLWITSKLWCTDHDPEEVSKALEATLADLQIDYLDLYLIHWPVHLKKHVRGFKLSAADFAPLDIPATWAAMEKLVDAKKTRAIGVSNFSCKKLGDLLAVARIPPAVNQVECSPVWQQAKLRDFCISSGVHLSAYSPLGSSGKSVLQSPVVKDLAQKLGKTPAQVALRWGLQRGCSVLPKSTNAERLRSNLQVFDFSIPEEELAKFSSIPQERVLVGRVWVAPGGPYESIEALWDGEI